MFAVLYQHVLGGASVLFESLVLIRGYNQRMWTQYPTFYIFLGFVFASDLARVAVAAGFGMASTAYFYAYYLPTPVMPFLQVLVLGSILRRVQTDGFHIRVPVVVLFLLFLLFAAASILGVNTGNSFQRFQGFALSAQVVVCWCVCDRVRKSGNRLNLGKNLKSILVGMGLLVALQMMNFAEFLFQDMSFALFAFLLQFIYFAALAVFVFGMWRYEPLQHHALSREGLARADDDLRRVFKALFRQR